MLKVFMNIKRTCPLVNRQCSWKKRHLKHVQIKFPIVPLKKYKFPTTTRVPQNGSQGTHNAQGVLNLISNRIFGQSIIVISTVRLTQLFTILIVSVLTIRLCLLQCYLHVQEVEFTFCIKALSFHSRTSIRAHKHKSSNS